MAKRAIARKMEAESLSEEMRVLYVAMTRARDRLIMTYAAKNLASQLQEIALRLDFDGGRLICREASCPGEWVLLTALQRTEAGAFHALGGRPGQTRIDDYPWNIQVVSAPEAVAGNTVQTDAACGVPDAAERILEEALAFSYPHMAATMAPSKQTATGRKGRQKDAEAAENTREPKTLHRSWRRPSFLGDTVQGKDVGSAIHAALQYIRYENCADLASIQGEVLRLADQGYLTREQAALVDCSQLFRFFETRIGQKLRQGVPHLREFKFSILDDGKDYGDNLEGEQVLLQGVVDCALLEEEGITIVDFKTDRVTEETLADRVEHYRGQVEVYAEALSRIYEMPVKEKLLYFFRLGRFVVLE